MCGSSGLTTCSIPSSSVARSATTGSGTRASSPAVRRRLLAASCNRASPRAQIVTEQPSCTRAPAVARPRPLLEPVTIAIFPVSSRSICKREHGPGSFTARRAPSRSLSDQSERVHVSWKCVLLGSTSRSTVRSVGFDVADDGALDRAPVGKTPRAPVPCSGAGEFLRAPRKNRDSPRPCWRSRSTCMHCVRLPCTRWRPLGAAPQRSPRRMLSGPKTPAADRAAADGEVDARVVEFRQHGLLDLVEGQRPPARAVRGLPRTRPEFWRMLRAG